MKWKVSLPCGCSALLMVLILSLPFAASSCGANASAAGSNLVLPPGLSSKPQRITWSALFAWTPATGNTDAAAWPWGQCTWFVVGEGHAAGDHLVRWSGDAWQWFANAQDAHYATQPATTPPQVGWIAVYARGHGSSSDGHVAVVVATTSTTYTIAESNVLGLGVIDERTLPLPTPQQTPLLEGWIE